MSSACFHCAEPIPAGADFHVELDGERQALCCPGCEAVARAIVDNGLADYYRYRSEPAQRGEPLVPDELRQLEVLDDEQLQREYTQQQGDLQEITLCLEGLTCAACAWLIEHQLGRHPAVDTIQVNTTTERARLRWSADKASLSELLTQFRRIGYKALPFRADSQEASYQKQSRAMIRRLGLTGLATMQVMMIAIGLYFGVFQDIEPVYRDYLRAVSWVLATPVVLYGARPFFSNAWHSLRARRLVMDVPVALAIGGAYLASTWATLQREGEVYFESICMFTFFLLVGRFLEMRARRRAIETSSNLLKQLPVSANRINDDDTLQAVPAQKLEPGDRVLVRPGEVLPADGQLVEGTSSVDESMLSGEHHPILRQVGDSLYAGSVNVESPFQMQVTASVAQSRLSTLLRLQEQALEEKPAVARLADRFARWFVLALLLIAGATAWYWSLHSPEDAFWITLAVLVATCPCALSLATPAALTCATARLSRSGVLLRSGQALEGLQSINRVVFDKTGTLTTGQLTLTGTEVFDETDPQQALAIATTLEHYSEHPIARAFCDSDTTTPLTASDINAVAGMGLEGRIDGQDYRIGRWAFLQLAAAEPVTPAEKRGLLPVYLSRGNRLVARFWLDDSLREDAPRSLDKLAAYQPALLTGDPSERSLELSRELRIILAARGASPEEKLVWIRQAQQQGERLLMVGDGVNDAPVLAAANISVAMGGGTDLAKNSADVVLLSNRLQHIPMLMETARRTRRIIRQNISWAVGYNLLILPLAASGHVVPWIAALGMSLSSVLVVTNSLRLLKETA